MVSVENCQTNEPVTLSTIRAAARVIAGLVHRTPLLHSASLSAMSGLEIYLKAECLQKTGSFKPRGALNRIARIPTEDRVRGVLTASAGNHSQGLAYAAGRMGIPVTVVMPANASPAKIEATRSMGAEIILHGEVFDESLERAFTIQKERGMTFVHPCIDPDVVSGAGTIGLEILEDLPDVDAIVVPIGGGGLISGIAIAAHGAREAGLPPVRVFGVQPAGAPSMQRAVAAGHVVRLETVRSIADGMEGRAVFDFTLSVVRAHVDEIVLVDDIEILNAITTLLTRCKLLAEGAGAAPIAAALSGRLPLRPGSKVVAVISGGNQDLGRLAAWISDGVPA